jgi:N-acetylmuramoyl-L-alanine amidase
MKLHEQTRPKNNRYQNKAAEAIAQGILSFIKNISKLE